ncbi:MAG: hypothetical protein JNL39_17685 [Opitutaceae bacterium]|nr:hypothetical protein [Opitutaceae bacterium]
MPRFRASLGFVAAAAFLGGCAHYQLGTGAAPAFRTLHIEPVANRTLLPQSQAIVSTHLREAFARDARAQLVNSAAGSDAILVVTITGYRREVAAAREGDTGLARKFNITLEAACTLRDQRAAKTIWENRPVSVTREVFTDGGQLQSEHQAISLLAESLAAKIVRGALDTW